jgi:hypothetical protein
MTGPDRDDAAEFALAAVEALRVRYPDHPSWPLDLDQYEIRACMVIEWRVLCALQEMFERIEPGQTPALTAADRLEAEQLRALIELHVAHWHILQRRHDAQEPREPGSLSVGMQIQPMAWPEFDAGSNIEAALRIYREGGWVAWSTRRGGSKP